MTSFYTPFDLVHYPEPRSTHDHRNAFQVDRDRVLFSDAFRKLQSKTQVFQSGEYDFYRTRLTHTIEVARIGRSICEFLNSSSELLKCNSWEIDPDLVEGIGLAHDLGHPPFGHIGERVLNDLMAPVGGFEGNAQTALILTELIYTRKSGALGMQPTRAFLDGVLKYKATFSECTVTSNNKPQYPNNHFIYDTQRELRDFVIPSVCMDSTDELNRFKSIECQIMDWADDTAYSIHDIADGIRAGFLTVQNIRRWAETQSLSTDEAIPLQKLCQNMEQDAHEPRMERRISSYISSCRLVSVESPLDGLTRRHSFKLEIPENVKLECALFKKMAFDLIFKSIHLQQIEFKGRFLLSRLFEAIKQEYVVSERGSLLLLPEPFSGWIRNESNAAIRQRLICNYLSSLTDAQAIRLYQRLFQADYGSISDLI
jgi:dGTPase